MIKFQSETAEQLQCRREEENRFDQLIHSGRRRDSLIAAKLLDKMITILRSPSGAWSTPQGQNAPEMFWRLDVWEDDSRSACLAINCLLFIPGIGPKIREQ